MQANVQTTEIKDDLLCSIVVPVYNGSATIERCLAALAQQTIEAARYEIIIVDDGSKDDTAAKVSIWITQHGNHIARLVQQKNAGPAAARNHGAQVAQAPILLFTDADCAPLPNWVAALTTVFTDETVIGAKGAYLTEQSALVPQFVQAEYEDRYDRMRHQSQIDFIDTYSAAYRRAVFLENAGFDVIFTTASVEDQEFSFRLAQKGYHLVFAPQAQVLHLHDSTLWEYGRRKYYIGYWKALLTRWHPERMVQDSHTPQVLKVQIVLLALIIGSLLLAIAGLVWSPLDWAWSVFGLFVLIFLVTTLPFLAKLAQKSWTLALIGPVMLATRALTLGCGFLLGTVHFAGTLPGARQPVIPGWQQLIKRLIDVTGALIGLIISIPLVTLAALAIKLDSPGPIFYWQVRIGENGRPFRIVKLRSMVNNAEEQLANLIDLDQLPEPVYKLVNDPRITRVGKMLRRTSLDEAPQFYNVLIGEMSLVGPRPEEAKIVALYRDQERRRLAIKPGLTGPMQINGRGNLTLAERLRLELDYIDNYSLRRDLQILLRTIPAIFRGHGAY